jgi:hypothetical protein
MPVDLLVDLVDRQFTQVSENQRFFAGHARNHSGSEEGAEHLGRAADGQPLRLNRQDLEAISFQKILQRSRAPAGQVIGRVIERVHTGFPTVPIGHAQGDKPISLEEGVRDLKECLGIFLVLEHFEKGNDIKRSAGIRPAKIVRRLSENILQLIVLLGELNRVLVRLDTGDVEAMIARGGDKISIPATDVEQAAFLRRARIA